MTSDSFYCQPTKTLIPRKYHPKYGVTTTANKPTYISMRQNINMRLGISLTLSQWSSSGNPVAIQCAWNFDPSVHWNATGEKLLVANVLPVVFQWSSNGSPVVFQCVPIMQINTGSPLEHHWVLASASAVPVASQCTCGSSGLPVWSVQWYPSVVTESGLGVIRSGHFPACDPLCTQLVWWELFELNWFHLSCNPKYTYTIMVLISKACTEWCWSTHTC